MSKVLCWPRGNYLKKCSPFEAIENIAIDEKCLEFYGLIFLNNFAYIGSKMGPESTSKLKDINKRHKKTTATNNDKSRKIIDKKDKFSIVASSPVPSNKSGTVKV
jgi:hypothetical protein